ncbi:hypothetical protein J25TS5_20560 [Paenibacillus faecis]|nr:hypothetical protein J25TS5_20560 [Paenibacillus faecis]
MNYQIKVFFTLSDFKKYGIQIAHMMADFTTSLMELASNIPAGIGIWKIKTVSMIPNNNPAL